MLNVVALGTTVDHETIADGLHDIGAQLFGQLFGGLLGGQFGAVLHGAFDELVLFDGLIGLLDCGFGQIVLAYVEQRLERIRQCAQLLGLFFGQCH